MGKEEGLQGAGFVGKVLDMQGMVDYQEGAVVSKTLLDKKTDGKKVGTISLFAFDKGQGLSEHTTPFDAFVYVFDGESVITIAGEPLNVKKGEVIIMPANKPHELKAVERFKMMLVMIRA